MWNQGWMVALGASIVEGSPAQKAAWEQDGPREGETGGRIWYKFLLRKLLCCQRVSGRRVWVAPGLTKPAWSGRSGQFGPETAETSCQR